MGKVVLYQLLSLDGVAEHPEEFVTEFDDVMEENLGSVIGSQDAVLLGRRTYDIWARYWPGSAIEPFASFINAVPKHVVTSTPLDAEWPNSTVVDGDPVAFVVDLKRRIDGDVGVHGSISLAQALLAAGAVDRLCLVVAPVVHVRGRKLFDGGAAMGFSLTSSIASPSGSLLLEYAPHR